MLAKFVIKPRLVF